MYQIFCYIQTLLWGMTFNLFLKVRTLEVLKVVLVISKDSKPVISQEQWRRLLETKLQPLAD